MSIAFQFFASPIGSIYTHKVAENTTTFKYLLKNNINYDANKIYLIMREMHSLSTSTWVLILLDNKDRLVELLLFSVFLFLILTLGE